MRRAFPLLLLSSIGSAAAGAPACPIPGEAVQWIADYCMHLGETDDVIAASDCIEREMQRPFRDDCEKKRHYKQALCKRMIDGGQRAGNLASCVDDPAFSGPLVERNGAP